MMSEVLDDERKEAFLQALHGLKEDQESNAQRERELQKQQQEQMEAQRRLQEEQRVAEYKREDEEARRREEAKKYPNRPPDQNSTGGARPKSATNSNGRPEAASRPSRAIPSSSKKVLARPRQTTPPTLYKRAAAMFASLQTVLLTTAQTLSSNPMAMMRTILFLLMFALAFGRRDIRERVRRMMNKAWEKVAGTVGMGVKVSYI